MRTCNAQSIAIDVFKRKLIYQLRNGNAGFAIHTPSVADPSPAVRLFMASIRNMPGKTDIHFTPAVAAHNQWTILQLVSKVCSEITQPEPREPHDHNIKFEMVDNLDALPKKRVQWEIESTIHMYKFMIERTSADNTWRNYFPKLVDVFVVTAFEEGLYKVRDTHSYSW
jgi:hypothetical protein